jgi:hypothetical protein
MSTVQPLPQMDVPEFLMNPNPHVSNTKGDEINVVSSRIDLLVDYWICMYMTTLVLLSLLMLFYYPAVAFCFLLLFRKAAVASIPQSLFWSSLNLQQKIPKRLREKIF